MYRRTVGSHRYRKGVPDRVRMPSPAQGVYLDTRAPATANFCQEHLEGDLLRYEPAETRVFLQMARETETVFDIGAHVGYYSLLASAVETVQNVVAFETLPLYADEIERHVSNNSIDDLRVVRRPVGQEGHTLKFGNFLDRYRGKCLSIDRFVAASGCPAGLLKVDVEGAELEVLCGASNLLVTHGPSLLVAVHPRLLDERFGASVADVLEFLRDAGYRLYRVKTCARSRTNLSSTEGAGAADSLLHPLEPEGSHVDEGLFVLAAYPM